ncbi:MAG: glycosyltransferase family 2 protein, partial [Clostridia bacterium]|nr:glycosyltransferase family 2 protein [Clostridia bacterium]
WDDFPFNLSVIRDVERVVVSEKPYYHFLRARADSETAKYVAAMYDKREEEQTWMEELFAYWGLDTEESREFLSRRYLERLIGCVENVTNRACTLSPKEKRATIDAMISTPRVKRYLPHICPRSKKMKLMLLPIRWGSVWLTYLEGRVISCVKSRNTKLFATLKANR